MSTRNIPTHSDTQPHRYMAFGLCLSLPFPARQLPVAAPEVPIDVEVTLGTTPTALSDLLESGHNPQLASDIQINRQGDMLWTTERARFWASGGTRVVVEPRTAKTPAALRHFVLYNCLPSILNQRGMLALHANAVAGAQGAMVFTGRSGAGKSTLFAALLARGLPMLADDVTALQFDRAANQNAAPLVQIGYPSYRLCADALAQLAPPTDHIIALGGPRNKSMLFTPQANRQSTPVPLRAIYILNPHPGNALKIHRVEGMHAFRLLQENSYNPAAALCSPHAFHNMNQVVQTCAIYSIERPLTRWTIDELADQLLASQGAPQRQAQGQPIAQVSKPELDSKNG